MVGSWGIHRCITGCKRLRQDGRKQDHVATWKLDAAPGYPWPACFSRNCPVVAAQL